MGMFDDMDDFGSPGGFGDSFDDGFGDSVDFGDSSNSFEQSNMDSGSDFNSGSPDNGMDFGGAFDDELGPDNGGGNGLKKQAIITIIVGIIGVLLVIFIATRISSCAKQDDNDQTNSSKVEHTTDRGGQNVDDLMSDNKVDRPTSATQETVNKNDNTWVSIDKDQEVKFNKTYQELMFTVTGIEHLAKRVDSNGNLVVKTQLTGGISGLTGTYTLDIPYSKGVKLVVGDSFTVKVQLGTYSGKTVVGEIVY
jgi:hypothetical protein